MRLRRPLASLLLALYVIVLHGLPALHQAFHRNDHVHELGGLRWLGPRGPHVHAAGERHEPAEAAEQPCAPRSVERLRAAAKVWAPPLHVALGPAHGCSALLAPAQPAALPPASRLTELALSGAAPAARDFSARPRARAPPWQSES